MEYLNFPSVVTFLDDKIPTWLLDTSAQLDSVPFIHKISPPESSILTPPGHAFAVQMADFSKYSKWTRSERLDESTITE